MLETHLSTHAQMFEALRTSESVRAAWQKAYDAMRETLVAGGTIYLAGNGGSAADAQHFAAELVGRFEKERAGYRALALTTDTSALTAIGNDYGFDAIFARQLSALAKKGDCFVGITTSGNSKDVLEAFEVARERGVTTILLSGRDGGIGAAIADVSVIVPSESTARIQEGHLILYHAWCGALEEALSTYESA